MTIATHQQKKIKMGISWIPPTTTVWYMEDAGTDYMEEAGTFNSLKPPHFQEMEHWRMPVKLRQTMYLNFQTQS